MKKILYTLLFSAFAFNSFTIYAGDDFGLGLDRKDKPFMKEIRKTKLSKKGDLFSLNIDIQLGAAIANNNFDITTVDSSTIQYNNTSSKVGPSIGAIVSFDFLGYGVTSGFQYTNKGFKTVNEKVDVNYFNIPLLIYFDFNFDKVIIDGNLGPYFGLNISQDEQTAFKIKNFDLGLTGNIQGAYLFQKHLGALLGLKYEYGGLNNLGKTDKINKITSQTFFIYSGVKFIL